MGNGSSAPHQQKELEGSKWRLEQNIPMEMFRRASEPGGLGWMGSQNLFYTKMCKKFTVCAGSTVTIKKIILLDNSEEIRTVVAILDLGWLFEETGGQIGISDQSVDTIYIPARVFLDASNFHRIAERRLGSKQGLLQKIVY